MKSIVYGGLDGIVTTFAIVAGASGGSLSPQVVLILGISNVIAVSCAYTHFIIHLYFQLLARLHIIMHFVRLQG